MVAIAEAISESKQSGKRGSGVRNGDTGGRNLESHVQRRCTVSSVVQAIASVTIVSALANIDEVYTRFYPRPWRRASENTGQFLPATLFGHCMLRWIVVTWIGT